MVAIFSLNPHPIKYSGLSKFVHQIIDGFVKCGKGRHSCERRSPEVVAAKEGGQKHTNLDSCLHGTLDSRFRGNDANGTKWTFCGIIND
jgi:hypothetical protein